MAITLVQSNSGSISCATSGTNVTVFTSNITQGNAVILVLAGESIVSATLNATSQALSVAVDSVTLNDCYIYYLPSASASPGKIITISTGATGLVAWYAYEVSGLGSASLDKTSTGHSSSSSSFTSGATGTTTAAAEFWVGGVACAATGATLTGPSSPWTNEANELGQNSKCLSGYQITSSTGAATYSGSINTSTTYDACVATFKPGNTTVALTAATNTVAAPAPGLRAGPISLPIATNTIAAPAPAATVAVPLPVAGVTIATPVPALPGTTISLPVSTVTVAAQPVGFVINRALIASLSAQQGVDQYGNTIPLGLFAAQGLFQGSIQAASIISTPIGSSTITGSNWQQGTITEATIVLDSGGGVVLMYSVSTSTVTFSSGSGHWTAPAGVISVKVECLAGAGGGAGGLGVKGGGNGAGGGGEYAEEPMVVVTAGNPYPYAVGTAGLAGSPGGNPGGNGGNSTFTGDLITVTANGGKGGPGGGFGGPGGQGSTNSIHFSGGSGGTNPNFSEVNNGGAGGGSSAGNTANGNNGANVTSDGGASGGTAPSGGGDGGEGGTTSVDGSDGSAPGGGGGAGWGNSSGSSTSGGAGAAGQIKLTYSSTSTSFVGGFSPVAAIDSYGNSVPAGVSAEYLSALAVASAPSTPSGLCVLYYTGGALYALGPSGTPVKLATT